MQFLKINYKLKLKRGNENVKCDFYNAFEEIIIAKCNKKEKYVNISTDYGIEVKWNKANGEIVV